MFGNTLPPGAEAETEHAYYARESYRDAAGLRWPNDKPVALALLVSVEYYDLFARPDACVPANVPGGFGRGPYPDFRTFSMRDYGTRVGIFRLIELLKQHGIRAGLAVDASTALLRPEVVDAALAQGWELIGHGVSGTDIISSRMTEAEERSYLEASLTALAPFAARDSGAGVLGWHGPEYGQSARTPRLLAEYGLRYLLDWPNDEHPVPMAVPIGSMLAVPMSADLDDVLAHWTRRIAMRRWVRAVLEALEQLALDGRDSARLLVLNLHPWLIGQPHRVTYLNELLEQIKQRDDIWLATPGEIAAAYNAYCLQS